MTFGRRQPRPQRAAPAPPLQPELPPASENVQPCANAATDIVALLLAAYTVHGRLQCGRMIAAGAALTGEFALRASGGQIGQAGLADNGAVDDVLFAGAPHGRPTAWMFIAHAAREAGMASYEIPRIEALASSHGDEPVPELPAMPAQENYLPRELPQNVGPRFRHKIIAIADAHDLTLREVTLALGAATGQLILRVQHDFPPRAAVTLAAETMLMTARMEPLVEAAV